MSLGANENIAESKRPYGTLAVVLLAGLALRIFLSQYLTYQPDFDTWRGWGSWIAQGGFADFYKSYWCDYMPGYLYALWGLHKIHEIVPLIPVDILFKLPANLADIGICVAIFYAVSCMSSYRNALIWSVIYLFNPAVLSNSTFWGQVDSVHSLPLLIAVLAVLGRWYFVAGVFAALAFMIKPQSIVVFPIIGFLSILPIIKSVFSGSTAKIGPSDFRPVAMVLIAAVSTSILVSLPYIWGELVTPLSIFTEPVALIKARFDTAYEQYQYASVNAFNFWGAVAMWERDDVVFAGLSYRNWGTVAFGLAYALVGVSFVLYIFRSGFKFSRETRYVVFQAITLIFFAMFLFVTRAHERHLLPTLVFLSIIAFSSWINWALYATLSLVYVYNMFYSYVQLTTSYSGIPLTINRVSKVTMFMMLFMIFVVLLYDYLKNVGIISGGKHKFRLSTD